MNVVTAVIKGRHSVRKFKPDPIDESFIHDAIECAVHAPTAMNMQPWLIGIVRSKDLLKKIAAVTDHGKFITEAPVCFAIFGERNAKYYLEDCCAATENLILGLQAYGVGSCWVAGDKKEYAEEIRTLLNVPEKYTLVALVPAGLPLEISPVPKKETKNLVFSDIFSKD
ncbi:nitroreductase family protein [Methanoregula sp.]|uniref:nitroreductase family protein n=1 Tax=Methanoregula sp. TaxID=2052170 RepID=UPI003BB10448